ncbi:MAG: four helix bundle protein [Thiotrichales bacterium]
MEPRIPFEDLDVWKRAALYRNLANLIDYGFRYQITRSGLSIPSNLAKGLKRGTNQENVSSLNYAQGFAGDLCYGCPRPATRDDPWATTTTPATRNCSATRNSCNNCSKASPRPRSPA